MLKDGKNKFKDNIIMKQVSFFILVLFWVLLIVFKNSLTGAVRWGAFVLMILLSIGGLYWINREFFGVKKGESREK